MESPGGYMAILAAASGNSELLRQKLFRACLLCGKCAQACPADLPLTKIFLANRIYLEGHSGKTLTEKIKFSIFQRPTFDSLKPFLNPPANREDLSLKNALRFRVKKSQPESGKKTVLLFPGCIGKKLRPSLARAACEAIKMGGFAVASPSGLRCCGKLPGFTGKTLAAALRANLKILMKTPFAELAVICPACLDMIRNIWPNLDGLQPEEREFCGELANRAHYIGKFLTPFSQPTGQKQKAVWHEGCQLSGKDSEVAMKALGMSPAAKAESGCCGGACPGFQPGKEEKGFLVERKPTASEKLAKTCRDALIGGKPEAVVTGCPHCQLALEKIFAKRWDKIRVFHATEYLCNLRGEKP